jgi:hypothetical protein
MSLCQPITPRFCVGNYLGWPCNPNNNLFSSNLKVNSSSPPEDASEINRETQEYIFKIPSWLTHSPHTFIICICLHIRTVPAKLTQTIRRHSSEMDEGINVNFWYVSMLQYTVPSMLLTHQLWDLLLIRFAIYERWRKKCKIVVRLKNVCSS